MNTLNSLSHVVIRLTVAVVASHFIVVHSANETWLELFTRDYYYLSLLYSGIIAFLLIEYVYRITKVIQKREKTSLLTRRRLKLQFYFGFLSAAALAIIMAALLFWTQGQNIFNTGYFKRLYIYILLFLFAANLLYLLFYHHGQTVKTIYRIVLPDQTELASLRAAALKEGGFALIFYENRNYFSLDFEGKITLWPHTIEETIAKFCNENYFQITRSEIIHRAAILKIKRNRFKTAQIEMVIPFKKELYTSRRKTVAFINWYDKWAK